MRDDSIHPVELKRLLESGARPVLLDVRQPEEVRAASIDGAVCIPMPEIAARGRELNPAAPTVVFCHLGVRSAHVAAHLRRTGFKDVRNLAGGIDAWSTLVDPKVPRYHYDGRRVQIVPSRV